MREVIFKGEFGATSSPIIEEVLTERCAHEWLEVNISGVLLGDFVDSENRKGNISSPDFCLSSDRSESEYGTFSYNRATLYLELAKEKSIQNLKGHHPLDTFNYYKAEGSGVTMVPEYAL